jgi:hypothetical protein
MQQINLSPCVAISPIQDHLSRGHLEGQDLPSGRSQKDAVPRACWIAPRLNRDDEVRDGDFRCSNAGDDVTEPEALSLRLITTKPPHYGNSRCPEVNNPKNSVAVV